MSRISSWRLALRLARREALRARGRSILAIVMIALPVLAVTAADVLFQTQRVSSVESLDRRLGTADAQVVVPAQGRPMAQDVDPLNASTSVGSRPATAPTSEDLAAALRGARLLPQRTGELELRTDAGVGWADALEVDLADPLADGLVRLTSGRLPDGADEVVVNQALLEKGYDVGDRLSLGGKDAPEPEIVGIAESAEVRSYPFAAGEVGSLGLGRGGSGPAWLVAGGPFDWEKVRELNAMGAIVLSRAVVEDPPPRSEVPEEIRAWDREADDATIAAAVLIVAMALLEVVLLAGPAFAVGARRQARSLALMAASGGTPAQSRRVVLASGVVLGAVAAVVGVVAGIGAGIALRPVLQRWSSLWFGPLEVPWMHLLGVAGFGLLSALLATLVPAWIASRQDVVAVLAGRRADSRPSVRSPILGLVLLGAGVAGAAYGATADQNGEFFIAGSAVVAVLGMILLVPVVVVLVARLSRLLPLSGRYAARDAARHRTRTVPAVAAVAATVAGVVTLGIALSSDEAMNEATYTASLPLGAGAVNDNLADADWAALRAAVERHLPAEAIHEVTGVRDILPRGGYREFTVTSEGTDLPLDAVGGALGAAILVDDGSAIGSLPLVPEADARAARDVLAAGGAVAFTSGERTGTTQVQVMTSDRTARGKKVDTERVDAAAYVVQVEPGQVAPRAVLSPPLADALGLEPETVSLLVTGVDISSRQDTQIGEAVAAVSTDAGFYVERGYQAAEETVIIELVLGGLGAVLMLGGTLTATFLALSDARPDLATLSAVGASPRRRRSVAAAYALVVGFVGALLGAAVGFVPGIAITYPLTTPDWTDAGPFLDVPWLLIGGLVVGLPLLTAAIVAASVRSRLPLVARLD